MTINRRWLIALSLIFSVHVIAAKSPTEFQIGYVSRSADPWYSPQRSYAGMELQIPRRPLGGVHLALKESRVLGRALGINFIANEITLSPDEKSIQKIADAVDAGISFIVLDLAVEEMQAVATHFVDSNVVLFNARHQDDELRRGECGGKLFHTIPSDAMLHDSLAQYLKKKRWNRVLVLEGPDPRDTSVARSFTQSAKKMGLKIVDTRQFILSNDPRERSQNNIALLTSGKSYDVVFVADEVGEFSRYIPYQTQSPALVIGSQGLMPAAWHWSWERHGAPQLNQRFERLSDEHMSDTEFAGWAAARTVISAVVKSESRQFEELFNYLQSSDMTLDLYKGFPGSYRSWNRQLRQPILLHTDNAVIASAPIEGFMHQKNDLDTLGVDERETNCGSQ